MNQFNDPTNITIALIGGTGNTGKWVLKGALEKGYKVKALARVPSKLTKNNKLTIIKGDVGNAETLKELFKDVDVVLSCLGTVKKPNYIVENGIKMIIEAIKTQTKPPKLIHISAVGLGTSRIACKNSFVWSMIVNWIFPLVGREIFADMERGEQQILANKELRFVITRAAVLSNAQAKGYKVQNADQPVGKMMISRKDVASFMLNTVVDKKFDGQAISLFSK